MQSSQENLKTIVCAKFGGQTKCIMDNWKIENMNCLRSQCIILHTMFLCGLHEVCSHTMVPSDLFIIQWSKLNSNFCEI